MECIDSAPWMTDLKRRVQHYGWRYDYSARFVSEDMKAAPIPAPMRDLAEMLHERGWFDRPPDQIIVNEYEPGQGIAPHVDVTASDPRWRHSHSGMAGRWSSLRCGGAPSQLR